MRRGARAAKAARPSVSIIAPMRNEAHNVEAWLKCVRSQDACVQEIIISDDASDDGTALIAGTVAREDARVRVIRGAPPPGWVGKTSAADRGARAASGEWLLFSDADMRMAPGTVAAALDAAVAFGADACSLTATLESKTLIEAMIMPAMAAVVMSGHPLVLVHDVKSPVGLVWGGFVLVRRDAYETIGGHASVRTEIAEDRALAERLKAFGYAVRLLDGHEFVRVRMYRGLREMWEGWRKNVFEGTRRSPIAAMLFIAAAWAMLVVPLPGLVRVGYAALRRPLTRGERSLAFACAFNTAAGFAVRALRDRMIGAKTWTAAAAPVAGVFMASVMAASMWRSLSGRGQTWKGRTIR
ncbi:MAG TPA: glycosyltransferase family A protein [Candidatus Eremiobacteraceae bacterium]|nr:glycosyltransferase family A protein [Candidatus Eremiobacteraceae bacterium]